jgi:PIN domain nuclease of toxin-antitoxin system
VLDASAMLAVINEEPGSQELIPELLDRAAVSAVNLAEVQGKLVSWGWHPAEAWEDATGTARDVAPFTTDHARATGNLISETRALGLSLGDRACLALGLALKAPVYTADRSWKKLKLGISIRVIR